MAKNKSVTQKAMEIIEEKMKTNSEMTRDELTDIVSQFYVFDAEEERKQAINRKTRQIMASKKDTDGSRQWLSCKLEDTFLYVDIETTTNRAALKYNIERANKNIAAENKNRSKARKRDSQIEGQMSLFDNDEISK